MVLSKKSSPGVIGSAVSVTSTDTINWSTNYLPISAVWVSIKYVNDKFIAISAAGDIINSSDGVTWSAAISLDKASNEVLSSIAYGNGYYLILCSNGQTYKSTDSVNWYKSVKINSTTNGWNDITFGSGLFVIIGDPGLLKSDDLINWLPLSGTIGGPAGTIVSGSDAIVAVWNNLTNTYSDGIRLPCGTPILDGDYVYRLSGLNNEGQLGLKDIINRDVFTNQIVWKKLNGIDVKVSHGYDHTMYIDESGALYAYGYNDCSQLGINSSTAAYVDTPILINTGPFKEVSCGYKYSIVRSNIGELFVCGCNESGQLGLGHFNNNMHFTKLS